MNRNIFFSFVALLIPLTPGQAKDDANPHWLSQAEIAHLVASEPPPPAIGSSADKADLQASIDAQKSRTPALIAEAKQDVVRNPADFAKLIDPNATPQNDPKMYRFLIELRAQIDAISREAKDRWKRLRPYEGHPDVIHPLFTTNGFSYPSGHAAHAYAVAMILGTMYPDRATALKDHARAVAQGRVDAGVHYPTDIQDGDELGEKAAKILLNKPAFQHEMQAVEAEIPPRK